MKCVRFKDTIIRFFSKSLFQKDLNAVIYTENKKDF